MRLYVPDVVSSVTRPVKELKVSRGLRYAPVETVAVAFEMMPEMLAFYGVDRNSMAEPGPS